MSIYTKYVTENQLTSPVNDYKCKRITKQNIKQFGFENIEDLLFHYPGFPLECEEYISRKSASLSRSVTKQHSILREKKIIENIELEKEYNKKPNICPKCDSPISFKKRNNKFCSRPCANSRGPRPDCVKTKISKKLSGGKHPQRRKLTEKEKIAAIEKRKLNVNFNKPNTKCTICEKDTGTKNRKTCSKECFALYIGNHTRKNPNCGGQKHTSRSFITNIKQEEYVAESSYEVILAKILNDLDIYWIRPSCVYYLDNIQRKRRYHPDFYLPSHNIYLDPKNDYLIKTDIDKIQRAANYNDIKIVVISKNYLSKEYIKIFLFDELLDNFTVLK